MCGIAGGVFWGEEANPRDGEAAVRAMVAALGHRGPDGHGTSVDAVTGPAGACEAVVVLGHTRLAILDVTDAGAQPMTGGRGDRPGHRTMSPGRAELRITYNGETYNFADLRAGLERDGVSFETRTDTEVVLRGFEKWGLDVLPRLRGMFAFALWDGSANRLVIARDRLGIKPLYYYAGERFFLFGSEVRALLASGLVPRRLDATALWQYLGYQSVPAPRTLIDGVRTLEPGTWMTVGAAGVRASGKYWQMLATAGQPADDVSAESARRRTGDLLRESVAAHMVSDVPVGAFLSGGIDSSAVVALMREAGHQPRTFAVGFPEREFDETQHAATVARLFRTDHTRIELHESDLLNEVPAALRAMDQPTGDGINSYVISRCVRNRGITVALSGLGGDELFGGYPSFSRLTRTADISRIWGRSPAAVRGLAAAAVRSVGSSVSSSKTAALLETDGSLASMFPLMRQVLSVDQRSELLAQEVLDCVDRSDPYSRLLADAYADAPAAGLFARISFAEARTYMHDVLLRDTDQMSMAHGLEVRVPLLDHRLVDHVVGLPDTVKHANGTPKRLLVESLEGLLPDGIVNRPKQGFVFPFDAWMRGPLRPLCEAHLGEDGLSGRGMFQPAAIQRAWRSFLGGGKDVSWSRLWTLVALDAWLERNPLS